MRESARTAVRRRILPHLFFLVMVAPALLAFAPPRQGQYAIALSISAGYNGHYERDQWIPVRVSVSNSGDDLNGHIRIRTGELGGLEEISYRTPIDLPNGARKQVFLYVSLESPEQKIQVEVVDRAGHLVERATADLRLVGRGDILYAVVTASPFGAVDLTALYPGAGTARQVNWRIEDIPPLGEALAGLDVLLFHDVNTGALKAEQTAALVHWVLSGGHLIVTGGESWQRTTAGLQAVLPVTLRGSVPIESLSPLAAYLNRPTAPLDEGITAADSAPLPAAQVLVSAGDVPILVRARMGAGLVDFLAVDPQAEPLRSWRDKQYLWYTLVASVGQQPGWANGFSNWSRAREATLTLFSTILPTFFQMCGFLLLYIALLGPVNYILLKRLNRREWAWFTIPALIALFSGLAYMVGFNLRGNTPTVSRLAVVRVWPDSEEAQVTALIGVQSPRRTTYDIAVERGFTLRTLPEEGIGLNVPAIITEGTRYVAESIPIDAGTVASFAASGYAPAPHLEASVTWLLSDFDAPRITGTIANTTGITLEDTVILVKGAARFVGTLEPGETGSFEIPLGPQDPGPLTLGNRFYGSSSYYFGYSGGSQYTYRSPGWCFEPSGDALTVQDVMNGERFSCSARSATARQQEIRRRYRLLDALAADLDPSGGRDSGAYLFAWASVPTVGVDLVGRSHHEEDTTLYIFELPVTAGPTNQLVEVPPGLTTWAVIDTQDPNTRVDISPVAFQVNTNGRAVFQFMPMPRVRLETVEELVIKFQGSGPVILALWDWDAEIWTPVQLSPDSTSTPVANAARFVGPENAVNVLIFTEDDLAYNRVDYVKVAYRGRLAG
jgi:hypothetical protein